MKENDHDHTADEKSDHVNSDKEKSYVIHEFYPEDISANKSDNATSDSGGNDQVVPNDADKIHNAIKNIGKKLCTLESKSLIVNGVLLFSLRM